MHCSVFDFFFLSCTFLSYDNKKNPRHATLPASGGICCPLWFVVHFGDNYQFRELAGYGTRPTVKTHTFYCIKKYKDIFYSYELIPDRYYFKIINVSVVG